MNSTEKKKVLIVYAHPEPQSLNGSLKDAAVRKLRSLGHEVVVSDLYGMKFKAHADADDFAERANPERLYYPLEQKNAYDHQTQAPDVLAEQEKLLWADAVILQFPMWWFSPPAIVKGWIDRVFARGFAYGRGQTTPGGVSARYGEGVLLGRKAMVSVTTGSRSHPFSERGVSGALEDLLFPLNHGVLFYTGMSVLPPFAVHGTSRMDPEDWQRIEREYDARLEGLFTDAHIPYRMQNGGHYDSNQELLPHLGQGEHGTRIHLLQRGDPEQAAPRIV